MEGDKEPEISTKDIGILTDKTRKSILKQLSKRKYTVSELSRILNLSKPTILYHLTILESMGYVKKIEDDRKWVYYGLTDLGHNFLKWSRIKVVIAIVALALIVAVAILFVFGLESTNQRPTMGGFSHIAITLLVLTIFLVITLSILFIIGIFAYSAYLISKSS